MNGLVFIRHAETDMAGTFCGHSNPPINARGREQLKKLIAELAAEAFDAIYSSDLRRAVDTATPIADGCALSCVTTPRLREIDFGRWEGLTWAQIEQQDPDYARRWLAEFPAVPAPEGEPCTTFAQRVLQQAGHLLHLAEDRRIAVVTHAGVMQIVLRTIMGYSEHEAWALTRPYCSWFVCTGAASRTAIEASPALEGEPA